MYLHAHSLAWKLLSVGIHFYPTLLFLDFTDPGHVASLFVVVVRVSPLQAHFFSPDRDKEIRDRQRERDHSAKTLESGLNLQSSVLSRGVILLTPTYFTKRKRVHYGWGRQACPIINHFSFFFFFLFKE